MNIKNLLKKSRLLTKGYGFSVKQYYKLLTVISPTLNTKVIYKSVHHKKLNLKNPKTFYEKLLWLKLNDYIKNPLVTKCADKFLVREYIKSCGYENILNELYSVYDNPEQIVWDELPDKFALKWNFGAGYNIICNNKESLDEKAVKDKLRKWQKIKCWLPHSEMQYKYIDKKIICERYLETPNGKLPVDYKVYCFNGNAKAILVMSDRDGENIKAVFMNEKWEFIGGSSKYEEIDNNIARPNCLEQMIEAAQALSKPFPFVRVDFYEIDQKLIFGEMTFTPAGGMYTSQVDINGVSMGELLDIGGGK